MIDLVRPGAATAGQKEFLLQLLRDVDHEFIPPLSDRIDSVSLDGPSSHGSLARYFEAMQQETWLLATISGDVVGVISFLIDYVQPLLTRWTPAAYVTTVAVSASQRGHGIAGGLYGALRGHARLSNIAYLATRTWSTNTDHLAVLRAAGFAEVVRCRDDRPGGLDTVYLVAPVNDEGSPP